MVFGEADILKLGAGCGELRCVAKLLFVVGFFEKSCFDLLEVGGNIMLSEPKNPEGDGFHHGKVAAEALGDSGILHLHGKRPPGPSGSMHLSDGGGMGGRSFKGFKNLSRILSKLPSKCPNHERVGERGCGILGTGKLLRIGRR